MQHLARKLYFNDASRRSLPVPDFLLRVRFVSHRVLSASAPTRPTAVFVNLQGMRLRLERLHLLRCPHPACSRYPGAHQCVTRAPSFLLPPSVRLENQPPAAPCSCPYRYRG